MQTPPDQLFLQRGDIVPATSGSKWAGNLLRECAKAISDKDSGKIQHLLWMLNELSSPYGDCEQKIAAYFLQALFCKVTDSGERSYRTLLSAAEKTHSFESARKVILKFQEASPWTTFGHVASNSAIMEALEGEPRLHIIDLSNTYCTQWPTLLESLATRSDETPHLKLSVVVSAPGARGGAVMKEIGQRMEKFARLMGVPFEFNVISGINRLSEVFVRIKEMIMDARDQDEALAVNCMGALRRVEVDRRRDFIGMMRSLKPRVVTVVEEEADFSGCYVNLDDHDHDDDHDRSSTSTSTFCGCFEECLRFYGLFFEMMEESFAPTSSERLMLERECARSIVGLLACRGEAEYCCERREKGVQWCRRLSEDGMFSPVAFSDDAVDDVKALLRRYQGRWSLRPAVGREGADASGLFLTWKEEPVVWASTWKP
ncbi:Protein short root [Apostasia shenzhenica]|uniref:Protein short root n=1 Tax=Apostasia shenzhenica TaxID=1088818 RepID=A0A2I0AL09_9ASPA|nr:Protein short root [Apostasia shenzhenica]